MFGVQARDTERFEVGEQALLCLGAAVGSRAALRRELNLSFRVREIVANLATAMCITRWRGSLCLYGAAHWGSTRGTAWKGRRRAGLAGVKLG